MKRYLLGCLAALAFANPANAACTETFNLGGMGPPAFRVIGNDFGSVGHFTDCYNFTLNAPGLSFGFTYGLDASWARDIDLTSASLTGGSLSSALVDTSPLFFSFGNLLPGVYQLVIEGEVTGRNGGLLGGGILGYGGAVATTRISPVPGPIAGASIPGIVMLAGALLVFRRRNQAGA